MKKIFYLAVVIFTIITNVGCLATQVSYDATAFHNAACDMYTNQAMDNLIRAKSNLPFVQLKYSALNVTDGDDYTLATKVTQQVLNAVMGSITDTYELDGTLDRKRQMSFAADPVTDQNDIYERYLGFAADPTLFVSSCDPPCGPVHLLRKCHKTYYWIPCEAAAAFQDLVLKTALMRGPESVPLAAYEVKILQVINLQSAGRGDIINGTIVFDKPVPNGEAMLVFDLDNGQRVRASLWSVNKDADDKKVTLGQPTTRLDIQWSPAQSGFSPNNLPGRAARIYSRDFPPEAPVPNPVLKKISADVNLIRLNQLSSK